MIKKYLLLAALIVWPQVTFAQVPAIRSMYWYLGDHVPPSSINGLWAVNKTGGINTLFFGDIEAQSNGTWTWDDASFATDVPALVSACHANGCKALVDIGVFGDMPGAITNNLSTMITNLMTIVNTYGLDGVAIDWEVSFSTSLNDNFVHALRGAIGSKLIMEGADEFSHSTYYGGAIKSYLDREIILNYDLGGCRSTGSGFYSWFDQPLYNEPSGPGSFPSEAYSWEALRARAVAAGTPASQIVAGVALTGRPWTSGSPVINHPLQACSGSYPTPDVDYRNLVSSYGSLMASPHRDSVTHEPWIQTPNGWWTDFEDATSLTDKVNWVKSNALGGWVAFNEVASYFSTQTPQQPLITALVNATGSGSIAAPNPPTGLTATVQ